MPVLQATAGPPVPPAGRFFTSCQGAVTRVTACGLADAGSSSKIENHLGFPSGISGAELAERARWQACRFGAEILIGREAVRGEVLPGKGVGYLADGTKIVGRATICATGVEYRRLGLPNEDRLLGAGVYYGAGASEASLCHASEDVFVVGGGNSARTGRHAFYARCQERYNRSPQRIPERVRFRNTCSTASTPRRTSVCSPIPK